MRLPGPPFRSCPNCGYTWSGFQSRCPKCGYLMSRKSQNKVVIKEEVRCSICGAKHGMLSSLSGMWYKCIDCGAVYCPHCASKLEIPKVLQQKIFTFSRERTCHWCDGRVYPW